MSDMTKAMKRSVWADPITAKARIEELEAEVKRWQQQSNKHYLYSCELDKTVADLNAELAPLEGRSAAAHMKYQGELETKVVKLTKERDKLREAVREVVHVMGHPSSAYSLKPLVDAIKKLEALLGEQR